MSIIAQFYPNGEFTHGVSSSHSRKSRLERLSDKSIIERAPSLRRDINATISREMEHDSVPVLTEFISAQGYKYIYLRRDGARYFYAVEPSNGLPLYVTELEHSPRRWAHLVGASPLGSSDAPNFTQASKPPKRKPSSLTRSMARTLRNAVYLLEHQYGKGNLAFLTLTLPDLPPEGLAACCDKWGKMIDRFLKWMRARIERMGGNLEYAYCTEVQTKRLTNRGEYALHLHIVYVGRVSSRYPWYITPKMARSQWVRCIKSVYSGDFRTTALENLQKIRKSAAAYLGKYISKGVKNNAHGSDGIPIPGHRGHWGGVSRALRQRLRQAVIRVTQSDIGGAVISLVLKCLRRGSPSLPVKFYTEGFIQTNKTNDEEFARGIYVGVGCLNRPTLEGGLMDLYEYIHSYVLSAEGQDLLSSA